MSILIRRQDAIDAICEHGTELERRGITVIAVANYKQATVDLLESLPIAQPEIVRCKDCKHYQFTDEKRLECLLECASGSNLKMLTITIFAAMQKGFKYGTAKTMEHVQGRARTIRKVDPAAV